MSAGSSELPESVSILGMGRTGVAVARYLAMRGVDICASDSREALEPGISEELSSLGVRLVLGANEIRSGDTVVISPGIKPHSALFKEAQERGSEVISEPELFSRVFSRPIVSITGTDGKSTVTTWIAHVLNQAGKKALAGGNLGNPLLGEEALEALDVAVLEISAFQLVTTHTLRSSVAVVTNIAEDHLDYFQDDAKAYESAKRRLVDLCNGESRVVLSGEDPTLRSWSVPAGASVFYSARSSGPDISAWCEGGFLCLGISSEGEALDSPLRVLPLSDLPLVGAHNERNALQVILAATFMGVPLEDIRRGLRSYEPLPHRCAVVGEVGGVRFINDSKATNPHAAMAALRGIDEPVILIAGGSEKGSDFVEFGQAIHSCTRALVATGETAPRIMDSLPEGHRAILCEDMESAVRAAFDMAKPGDTVLLSPGCASFDAFRSYGHRGEVFTELVRELISVTET